jgi:hypothetical protein
VSDDFRMTWQAAYQALQRMGMNAGAANEVLALARKNGSHDTQLVDVQFFANDDTFGLYTESLDE